MKEEINRSIHDFSYFFLKNPNLSPNITCLARLRAQSPATLGCPVPLSQDWRRLLLSRLSLLPIARVAVAVPRSTQSAGKEDERVSQLCRSSGVRDVKKVNEYWVC